MAYIGAAPSTNFRRAPVKDSFTGDGSETEFDLANIVPAGGENALQVFIDNVRQEPGSGKAYTLGNDGSGDLKRITFSAAPASSAVIYVLTNFSNEAFGKQTDLKGSELALDADGDTTITADSDDTIDIKIAGADDFQFTANTLTAQSGSTIAAQALTATTISASSTIDMNGVADGLIIDADGDTTISAPTDDQIDIEIAGADDFTFAANTFTALAGSHIVDTDGGGSVRNRPNSKPLIINGNMAIAQRGTSFASVGDGVYTLDRFETNKTMDAVATITQETLTSGNAYADGFKNAFKVDVTTADASLTGTQRLLIQYGIEGQDLQVLKFGTANAEKLTLSFWVKATKTGTNIVRLYAPDDNRAVSASYTVSSTDTWEKKVLNFPADTTGVIDDDNGAGIQVAWAIGAGPDFQSGTLATTWGTQTAANDFVGQVNNLDSTSNNWHLTGVQLEVGEYTSSTIPPFQHESYGDNLNRCARYYQVIAKKRGSSYENELIPAVNHESGKMYGVYNFRTEMRSPPTLSAASGTGYFRHYRNGSYDDFNSVSMDKSSVHSCSLYNETEISGTAGHGGWIRITNSTPDDSLVALIAEL